MQNPICVWWWNLFLLSAHSCFLQIKVCLISWKYDTFTKFPVSSSHMTTGRQMLRIHMIQASGYTDTFSCNSWRKKMFLSYLISSQNVFQFFACLEDLIWHCTLHAYSQGHLPVEIAFCLLCSASVKILVLSLKKSNQKNPQKPQQTSKQNTPPANQAWIFNLKAIFRLRRSDAMTYDFYFFQSHDCQQIK